MSEGDAEQRIIELERENGELKAKLLRFQKGDQIESDYLNDKDDQLLAALADKARLREMLLAEITKAQKVMSALVTSIERWESAIEQIIGRVPRTYIELDHAKTWLEEVKELHTTESD